MRDGSITTALRLPEVQVVREEETNEEITVEIRYRSESAACPRCGQRTPKLHSARHQWKRDRQRQFPGPGRAPSPAFVRVTETDALPATEGDGASGLRDLGIVPLGNIGMPAS